ncbi:hypothetical protein LTR94_036958, partial [Friedmanniomyces endolithicus]
MIDDAVERTSSNTGPILAIALNYGAQAELVEAARRLASKVAAATPPIRPDQVLAGLIVGASLGPPNCRPTKNAPLSQAQTNAIAQSDNASPSS